MNWKTTNFDWNHARAYLLSAEKGSFTAAAGALASTQPTIGRQVVALEFEAWGDAIRAGGQTA